mmetsp:Transcript_45790/g.121648  ORF Transcript_45790/g.121648 Transcript_45790/m.121648 type:complete len:121 (-) Transcript_45790:102-464(-)
MSTARWSEIDVGSFITANEHKFGTRTDQYVQAFKRHSIDGECLDELDVGTLTSLLGIDLGHAIQFLKQLKERRQRTVNSSCPLSKLDLRKQQKIDNFFRPPAATENESHVRRNQFASCLG